MPTPSEVLARLDNASVRNIRSSAEIAITPELWVRGQQITDPAIADGLGFNIRPYTLSLRSMSAAQLETAKDDFNVLVAMGVSPEKAFRLCMAANTSLTALRQTAEWIECAVIVNQLPQNVRR